MQNHFTRQRIAWLILAISIAACEKNETVISAVVCEDMDLEIEFVVPDSFLRIDVLNGTPPYTYQWGDGSTRSTLSPPASGSNTVTVTDANGCTAEGELETQTGCQLWVRRNFTEDTEPDTYVLSVEAFGDNPPFSYTWSDGESDNSVTITEAGHYDVSVMDANGCLIGTGVTMNNGPDGLCQLRARIRQESDGRLRASASISNANTSYLWSDGSTEREILNPVPGALYSITITSAEGCPATAELQL